jgi:hypothetical protein
MWTAVSNTAFPKVRDGSNRFADLTYGPFPPTGEDNVDRMTVRKIYFAWCRSRPLEK